jgi:hypothetical protein
MAIASRWPFSDQIEMPGEKGVSVMGSLIESLVGALAEGYSGVATRPLYSRYTAVARFRPGLALRLAEGRRGLCRAQPVILVVKDYFYFEFGISRLNVNPLALVPRISVSPIERLK